MANAQALLAAMVVMATMTSTAALGPIYDYPCFTACLARDGWNPICVDNDRVAGVEGSIFPNACSLKCTSNTNEATPYYNYLPFDDLTCSSAVGCSLLSQSLARCQGLWEVVNDPTAESPKVADDCSCALRNSGSGAVAGDGAPALAPATF